METAIKISFLNDFIFCPRSLYFHNLYGNLSRRLYASEKQSAGKKIHGRIDQKRYSTEKTILQGTDVFCSHYGLYGKIDLFNQKSGVLTERKKKVKIIYDGYIFQLYAQYFSLQEMGYTVKELRIYSFDDNKVFPVLLPEENQEMLNKFETLLKKMQNFSLEDPFKISNKKCLKCVYAPLCDKAP